MIRWNESAMTMGDFTGIIATKETAFKNIGMGDVVPNLIIPANQKKNFVVIISRVTEIRHEWQGDYTTLLADGSLFGELSLSYVTTDGKMFFVVADSPNVILP